MRSKSIGDTLINPEGKELTIIKWKPGIGLFSIGKWFLKDSKGKIVQLSSVELQKQDYDHKTVAP